MKTAKISTKHVITNPRQVVLRAYKRFEKRKIFVSVSAAGEKHIAWEGRVGLEIFSKISGKVWCRHTTKLHHGKSDEVAFSMAGLPSDTYDLRAVFIDQHGVQCRTELLQQERPDRFPWLDAPEGITDKAPAPWIPVKLQKRSGALSVSCWGRQYDFASEQIIKAVQSAGKSVLSGPIRFMARVGGKTVWLGTGRQDIFREKGHQVIFNGSGDGREGLLLRSRMEIDFDGMIRIDWLLSSRKSVRLDALVLKIPVKAEHAKYLYHFPGKWGSAANVGDLPPGGVKAGFWPYIWLGDEERGLAWFTESNKNWYNKPSDIVTRITRQRNAVVLKLHLISTPINLVPAEKASSTFTGFGENAVLPLPGNPAANELHYTFGIQATPVKPVEKDAWDQRTICLGPTKSTGFRPPLHIAVNYLDQLVKAGVRTVVIFEYWTDAEGYTRTSYCKQLKKIVRDCHERGLKVLLYFNNLMSDLVPEWRSLGEHCSVHYLRNMYPIYHYLPQPEQSVSVVCLNSEWQDCVVSGIGRAMDEFDLDGVYLDGTIYPFGCGNTLHGCGKIDADGNVAITYPIFAVRSAMRRIYTAVRSRKPDGQVNAHNSTCMVAPTLGWATSYWDGEQFGRISCNADVTQLLPLDAFRAEFMGRQWGVPAEFLCYGAPLTYEQSWAVALLHDVPVRPNKLDLGVRKEELRLISSVWKVMDDFGRKAAEWLPYWCNSEYVSVSPKGVYISLYRHPQNGVLAIISNISNGRVSARIDLDLQRLGLHGKQITARDALNDKPIKVTGGKIAVNLPPFEWKMIDIR